MSELDFSIQHKAGHVAPDGSHILQEDFPMDEVLRRLDGDADEPERNEDSTQPDPGQVMRVLLTWIGSSKARDPRAINFIGKRAIAAVWVINPKLFGDAPAHMVAKSFGISSMKFNRVTAEFSRQFGLRNRFQDHDWQNKKGPPVLAGGLGGLKLSTGKYDRLQQSADTYPARKGFA